MSNIATGIPVSPELVDDMLSFVQLSSLGMKRALDELSVHRAQQQKAAALRSELLKHLVNAGVVPKGQEKMAEAMLASHDTTFSLLKNAVDRIVEYRTEKRAGDVGRSVSEKEAGLSSTPGSSGAYNSLEDGYVGRRTSEKKASDLAIMAVMDTPR